MPLAVSRIIGLKSWTLIKAFAIDLKGVRILPLVYNDIYVSSFAVSVNNKTIVETDNTAVKK